MAKNINFKLDKQNEQLTNISRQHRIQIPATIMQSINHTNLHLTETDNSRYFPQIYYLLIATFQKYI